MKSKQNLQGRTWKHQPLPEGIKGDYAFNGKLLLSVGALRTLNEDEDLLQLAECLELVKTKTGEQGLHANESFVSNDGVRVFICDTLSKEETQKLEQKPGIRYMLDTAIICLPDELKTMRDRADWMKNLLLSTGGKQTDLTEQFGWKRQKQENIEYSSHFFNGMVYSTQRISSELNELEQRAIMEDLLLFAAKKPEGIDYLQVYVNTKTKQKIFAIDNYSRTVLDDPNGLLENKIRHHYTTLLFAEEY
ncbi:MAG: hypothetical protein JWQ09_3150 [Segetibacter sp.]|nr:hypothetical protein [Segetibacter sp.]